MLRIASAFDFILSIFATLAALLLFAMVLVVTGDIVLRNSVRWSIVWANEVSEYALYFMTLLVAPWLLRHGRHVRLDIVLTLVPQRIAWRMEMVADVLGFFVCLVLVRYGAVMTYESWRLHSTTIKNLAFPEWWLLAPLPAAFALLAIEFLFRMHRLFRGDRRRRNEATSVE